MALTINVDRTIRVIKELNFVDNSLDPEKSRVMSGDYMRIDVLNPTYIQFTPKQKIYTDADIKNNYKKEKIEDIVNWPTIREFMKKRIVNIAQGVELDDVEEKPTKPRGGKKSEILSLDEPTEE